MLFTASKLKAPGSPKNWIWKRQKWPVIMNEQTQLITI